MKKTQYLLLCAVATFTLSACSPTIAKRGNIIEDHQISDVVKGVHTRKDILRIMGSPTTIAPFDENTWYYIGQRTEKHGILDPKVAQERIVVVRFDDEGLVHFIKEKDGDRLDIPLARAKTPTHGNDITVIDQLLGNVGKFNTEEF